MANSLDLEEQEQLEQVKHFWKQYGSVITWVMLIVLVVLAGYNLYHYWQRRQATQAAALFDEVLRTVQSNDKSDKGDKGDTTKTDRVFADMKDRFASTTYAWQTGLMVAKQYFQAGKPDAAQAALTWVAAQSSDPGYQAIAKLRLAAVLADKKYYAAALNQLSGTFPASFDALVSDRRADVMHLQGNKAGAVAEYQKAYRLLDAHADYRRFIAAKLNALGVDESQRDVQAKSTTP